MTYSSASRAVLEDALARLGGTATAQALVMLRSLLADGRLDDAALILKAFDERLETPVEGMGDDAAR